MFILPNTAVLLDYEQYEALLAELEDLADLASLEDETFTADWYAPLADPS